MNPEVKVIWKKVQCKDQIHVKQCGWSSLILPIGVSLVFKGRLENSAESRKLSQFVLWRVREVESKQSTPNNFYGKVGAR